MSDVKFRYIREPRTRKPVGCIAYRLRQGSANDRFTRITYGWSMCNPSDNWDSKRARMIAEGRLNKGLAEISCKPGFVEVSSRILIRSALHELQCRFGYDLRRTEIIEEALGNDYDLQLTV